MTRKQRAIDCPWRSEAVGQSVSAASVLAAVPVAEPNRERDARRDGRRRDACATSLGLSEALFGKPQQGFARPVESHRLRFCRAKQMNPERALNEQIERYRAMTGEQRLALGLALHELACNVAREGIRRQHPDAADAEVERRLRHRLELARR